MKKLSTMFLSISMLSTLTFATVNADEVVATYVGGEINKSQIMQELKPQLNLQSGEEVKNFDDFPRVEQEKLIKIYVNSIFLKKEVEKSNIMTSKEFLEKLENAKMQLAQQELITNYLKSHITDKMVNDEYEKYVGKIKGKQQIDVAHILVKTQKEANDIKNRLNKGEKFAALAKEKSIDEASKAKGGDIGYIVLNQPGQLVEEFEKKAFSLKVNEISAPVKTEFGWHIITVLDKKSVPVPTKEEAKPIIDNILAAEIIKQYINELEQKADLKIMLPNEEEDKTAASKTK